MKELLILSGKGGTGKTTIASAFIKLSQAKAFADCDVDAPNLHLVINPSTTPKTFDYYGMDKGYINLDKCNSCGLCYQHCAFDAIKPYGDTYKIDYYSCEGCGVCEKICPTGAVSLKQYVAGELMLYRDDNIFSTAQLKMGNGTSGLLVSEVKKQMKSAISQDLDLAIIDGSPGIGCPVIASISGVDMVLIVAEPSISGISDMKRIISTTRKFHTKTAVCVNKYDTNLHKTEEIKDICRDLTIPYLGGIPFDKSVVEIINNGKSIVDIHCAAGVAAEKIFQETIKTLNM